MHLQDFDLLPLGRWADQGAEAFVLGQLLVATDFAASNWQEESYFTTSRSSGDGLFASFRFTAKAESWSNEAGLG